MRGNIITKAFWANKSTVDFIGCLNDGRMVAFDCKECSSDRFPLSNIKEHQYGYLRQINEYGGKAFILLYFSKLFRFARLDFDNLQKYWELKECQNGKRGTCSIPASELLVNEIKINGMILDYLGGVEWKSSTL
jgi:recombination protein U